MTRHTKNQEIEALRGVAVLMVMWNHMVTFYTTGGGIQDPIAWKIFPSWSGVDLFFCISGYVVTLSVTRSLASSDGSFLSMAIPFWLRRVWRLLPSAWFWLAVTMAMSVWYNSSGAFVNLIQNIGDTLSVVFQVSNFHFLACIQNPKIYCGANWQYWSLSLEEQFYMVFPFFVFFVPQRWRMPSLAAIALGQILMPRPPFSFGWVTRTDAICLGVIIAMAQSRGLLDRLEPMFLNNRPLAIVAFLVCLTLIAALPSPLFFVVPFYTGLIAVLSAAFVFCAAFGKGYVLPIPIFGRALAWIGSRSYGLYLVHYVAYHIVLEHFFRRNPAGSPWPGDNSLLMAATAIPLAFALAEINYRLIEQPGIRKGQEIARRIATRISRPEGQTAVAQIPSARSR
ncbi:MULTISPECIES: acyltransferase family protein [Burkholderia cepacia complex]|uniref:O-acetyltransferase OatA,Uncharacterized protein conserved in bacteria,Acyltransferase family n=2 Tax=Burkholderia cepacia complex TaxID=87882 RepID=A0AAJ5N3W3_9BURK|nr:MULTISPECIES: acyltransferase [Burkholderia cepacia complex]VBB10614.1 O-acetyltransferase OatA,Uncharacterized protein conserved in bacteria,Acyltransferase family [Burkholderia stabilis]